MLRSSEEKAPVPQNKFMGDIEELAASYERKLIEVSAVFFILFKHFFGPGSVTIMCFTCWMCQWVKKMSNESQLLYIGVLCIAHV